MFRVTIACIFLLLVASGCRPPATDSAAAISDLYPEEAATEVAKRAENWTAALQPREFQFPADHGAHEDYRIEWWYYTGNLEAADGRRFGYQLTFFRTGLNQDPDNPSRWAVRDLYTAHFAVSDLHNKQHHCFQRNSRRGIGQAGAEMGRFEVWNGDWKVWLEEGGHRLRAVDGEIEIDLQLSPTKPPVLHGDQGLSQKGATAGNASHYYSLTRLATEGTMRVAGQEFQVEGQSWMDHEFSTSFLEPGQRGWDWLSIQLDNNIELMLYRMRRDDGSTDPFSSASLVDKSGTVTHLAADEFRMLPVKNWESSQTGGVYPLHWRIEIPSLGYLLNITPAFDEQEMTTSATTGINYWEGAIVVDGSTANGDTKGRGYMELTGYTGQGLGSLFD